LLFISMGWDYVSELRPPTGLLFIPQDDIWVWRATVEWYWQGKPKNSEKNLPQCHFVHHNSTWTDPGTNLGLRGERVATNRLSHATAYLSGYFFVLCTEIIRNHSDTVAWETLQVYGQSVGSVCEKKWPRNVHTSLRHLSVIAKFCSCTSVDMNTQKQKHE